MWLNRGLAAAPAAVALATALAAAAGEASLYGVNAHVPSPAVLDEIAASGARWVRIDVAWSSVEPAPDRFDWAIYDELVDGALERGLRLYATLSDTPAWATDGEAGRGVPRSAADWYDVCYRAAARYRGRIDHWGMWNEPNVERFWAGGRGDYIDIILKPGAAAVHAASPTARVCGPELAHLRSGHWDAWLRDVLKRASASLDVVTHHIYPDGASSRSVVDLLSKGSGYPWDPPAVKKVLQDTGWLGKPFWLTETGYSSGATGSGEQAQAAFVANLAGALFGPERTVFWVHKVFFYEITDDPRFAPAALGLLGPPPEYRRKAAFGELQRVAVTLAADDAEVVRVDFPEWLPAGAAAQGTVTVRNTGTTAWSAAAGYRLVAAGGGAVAAVLRDDLELGEVVAPGEEREFVLDFLAPVSASPAASPHESAWQMSRDGRGRFGDIAIASIAVGDGGNARSWSMPSAASVTEAGGARWTSDVVLHNRGSLALTATVSFLAEGDDNRFARAVSVTVAAWSSAVLVDVVARQLGTLGRGALRVHTASAALLPGVLARVQTATGRVSAYVPAQGGEHAIPAGGEGRVLRLARSGGGSALRSDLELHNPADSVVLVEVELLGDGGPALGTRTYELAPHEVRVVEDVLGVAGIEAASHAQALVRPAPGGSGVHAWALRRTGGGAPDVLPAVGASDEPVLFVPVEGGSRLRGGAWRTDVQLANPDPEPAVVSLELLAPAGLPPRVREVELEVAGGGDLVIDDALAALFGFRGSGALLVTPRSGRIAAAAGTRLSRSPAPFGRTVAPVPIGRAVVDGGECRVFPVTRARSAAGVVTHLGLVNLSGAASTLQVQVLDAAGRSLRLLPVYLAARELRQLPDFLQAVPAVDGGACVLVLRPHTAGSRFVAYATVAEADGASTSVPCS